MADPAAALATQLKNIEGRTGKSLAELRQLVQGRGDVKHGELRDWLKTELGLGYGDANTLAHWARQADAPAAAGDDPLDAIYAGAKAALRPLHDHVLAAIGRFGEFEVAPKKAYVSLRRRKQFAMVGPATQAAIEIGINAKDLPASPRLKAQGPGKMCDATVRLSSAKEFDAELKGWLRQAFDAAG